MYPYIILDPVEIPGWGQVGGAILQDAATEAEFTLAMQGPEAAMKYAAELRKMIERKTWRSEAAFDVLQRVQRALRISVEAPTHLSTSKSESDIYWGDETLDWTGRAARVIAGAISPEE